MKKLFLAAGAAALILCACDKEQQIEEALPTVTVCEVQNAEIIPSFEYVGRVYADDEIAITPRVNGYLLGQHFRGGQIVDSGQLLFSIDDREFLANVQSAEAEVLIATANLRNAEKQLKRQEELYQKEATPLEQYENALYAKIEMQGRLEAAKAKHENARLELSYTRIYAPFKGRIGLVEVKPGNLLQANQGVLTTLVKLDPVRVRISLSELDLLSTIDANPNSDTSMKFGSSADRIRVSAIFQTGRVYAHEGRVAYFDNRLSSTTGTIILESLFPNPEDALVPGMFVRERIELRKGYPGLRIPLKAIRQTQAGAQVTVINEKDEAVFRIVELGHIQGNDIEIRANLKAGERVVTEGFSKARPGTRVQTQLEKSAN